MKFKFLSYQNILLVLLLFLTFFIPFMAMRNFSPAVDEIAHLPSGYSYLKTGEIKLNPQHPPLIKMLAALPLLFLDIKFDPKNQYLTGPEAAQWKFGQDFLADNDIDRVIFWGRLPMLLLSVLLGWYIFKWSKETVEAQNKTEKAETITTETRKKTEKTTEKEKEGWMTGLIALFLYAFMPNIIAHSSLVTTDMGLAVFSFITLYYFWKLLKSDFNERKHLIYSGVFFGLALGSKFSAVFLLPILFILLTVYIWSRSGESGLFKVNLFLKTILPILGLAFLVIWPLYFFSLDPLFYWKGLISVYTDHNPDFQYYLTGNFKTGGWWYYFILAFIIKTPVPFLIALAAALFYFRRNGLDFLNNTFILLPPALFLFITSWKANNIGVRYILVIYPFLILFVSGWITRVISNWKLVIGNTRTKIKIGTILIFVLVGWYIYSAVSVYPDYLSYFNELISGPDNGYKYLDDSNIEWGHDLKRLAEYQKKNPDLKVAYAWSAYLDADRFYHIKNLQSLNSPDLWLKPKGRYAVSAHAVIRTRLASLINKNDKINWMDKYQPVDRIGQSFFIYRFD